jgi:hypothetical protein
MWKVTNKVLRRGCDKLWKWVKTMYMPESTITGRPFHYRETKGGGDITTSKI